MRLNNEAKKRFTAEIRMLFLILAVGLFYYLFVTATSFKIPCVFYEVTGLLCPGCGMTRMCISLIQLDFESAFGYNKCIFVTLPVLFYIFVSMEINYIKNGKRQPKGIAKYLVYFEAAAIAVFGIVRNII